MVDQRPSIWCTKEERAICAFAQALQPSGDRDMMSQYLIGSLDGEKVARMIHHNNIFHDGTTGAQMLEFFHIVEEKKQWDVDYDKKTLLDDIIDRLVEIEKTSAPSWVVAKTFIYPAVKTGRDPIQFTRNIKLQERLCQNADYGYHSRDAPHDTPLNLNDFTINAYRPGELPVLTLSGIDQEDPGDEVIFIKTTPPPLPDIGPKICFTGSKDFRTKC